jgi:hypothetical protein
MRGEKGLQALEWIARALVALALLAALAFGLRRTEAGLGEALSAAVSAWFRCLIGQGDCPLMAVRIEKAGPCWTQPVGCLARWGDCLLQGACEGADPKDLLGLLPWLAVVGIPVGGVVFALLPSMDAGASPALPPPPLRRRAFAVALLLPFLLVADLAFALLTFANTLALIAAPDPISRLELLIIEGTLFAVELLLVIAHIQLIHWMVTGKWIRRWEDMKDWEPRP